MFSDSLTAAKDDTTGACRCDCGASEKRCCRLECLVQPRFFCGQLLTDDDLKAVVDWAAGKFRLARYRHGWGVVCGLEVRCDPKRPSGIIVAPGYAIDCCGNDIIVCEDYPFDVSEYCPSERCEEPYQTTGSVKSGAERLRTAGPLAQSADPSRLMRPLADAMPFDLVIRYEEEGASPRPSIGRCGCGETTRCEHSRIRESFRLELLEPEAQSAESNQEKEDALEQTRALKQFVAGVRRTANDAAASRTRLQTWLNRHPLRQFCFVSHLVDRLSPAEIAEVETLTRILFWIVQDFRNSRLSCSCYTCDARTGVPLARLWISGGDRSIGEPCRVLAIEWRVPYRRLITPVTCWTPPRPGCISLAEWIWRDPLEAQNALNTAGVRVTRTDGYLPTTWEGIDRLLDCDLLWACDDEDVVMETADAGDPLGARVVGFCRPSDTTGANTRESEAEAEGGTNEGSPEEGSRAARRSKRSTKG